MKNTLSYLVLLVVLFTFGCTDEIITDSDFRPQYSLNCILRGDTSFQYVTITESYPSSVTNNKKQFEPFVREAEVRLWMHNDVYVLKDSLVTRTDTSEYTTPISFYYTNQFKLEQERTAEVEAILPNGKKLTSSTKIPKSVIFDSENSNSTIPPSFDDIAHFIWEDFQSDLVYSKRLKVTYFYIDENGNETRYSKLLPYDYQDAGLKSIPLYPVPGFEKEINYKMSAISSALEELSEIHGKRENIYIQNAVFELTVFDENLSAYFVTTNFLDEYSVRLDEVDFSNVNGGLGIFGSYLKQEFDVKLSNKYIQSFGFKVYDK